MAREFIDEQFGDEVEELDERTLALANPKTTLQEVAQGQRLPLPEYVEVGTTGPDHGRRWVFDLMWNGEVIARGEARTKRGAQKRAARRALIRLGLVPED